mmetsp:Transcript_43149/g.71271  ORF Transcript_43149/g.71271 Transcript_43149/m.71271 type:complete len:378 (-) Transcript_43149:110-1243(-)
MVLEEATRNRRILRHEVKHTDNRRTHRLVPYTNRVLDRLETLPTAQSTKPLRFSRILNDIGNNGKHLLSKLPLRLIKHGILIHVCFGGAALTTLGNRALITTMLLLQRATHCLGTKHVIQRVEQGLYALVVNLALNLWIRCHIRQRTRCLQLHFENRRMSIHRVEQHLDRIGLRCHHALSLVLKGDVTQRVSADADKRRHIHILVHHVQNAFRQIRLRWETTRLDGRRQQDHSAQTKRANSNIVSFKQNGVQSIETAFRQKLVACLLFLTHNVEITQRVQQCVLLLRRGFLILKHQTTHVVNIPVEHRLLDMPKLMLCDGGVVDIVRHNLEVHVRNETVLLLLVDGVPPTTDRCLQHQKLLAFLHVQLVLKYTLPFL